MLKKNIILILAVITFAISAKAQLIMGNNSSVKIDYTAPKDYKIGGITVSGSHRLDQNALILLSGLTVGEKVTIPGDDIANAIRKLWKQNLFSDVKISIVKVQGGNVFFDIAIEELPRLSKFRFEGTNKSEADDLREEIRLYREKIVTQNLVKNTENTVRDFFVEKGFKNVEVNIDQIKDSTIVNHVILIIKVKKNKKVKIERINVLNNQHLTDGQIRRAMKETKEKTQFHPFVEFDTLLVSVVKNTLKRDFKTMKDQVNNYLYENVKIKIFKTSKFLSKNYSSDKIAIIEKYNSKGFRDARIKNDSIYKAGKNNINIDLTIDEGNKYYFRNITFVGNKKYPTKTLLDVLGIEKGDVFDQTLLDTRLQMNPNGRDVSSLYMDDGYLFFQANPVEVLVENDSIDIEIRIYEGDQARVNKVTVSGNTKTNDHVIIREIRTKPGMLFSRSDIIRTQRELAQLGFFDPERMNVIPTPNPQDGTVDIEYVVAEKSSDQIELSGGWGGGRVVGTLGLSFNNFSAKSLLKKDRWDPLPSGDGQKLSIRGQSNGLWYQSLNFSFTEPWLGGKKPVSFTFSGFLSRQSNGQSKYIKNSTKFRDFARTDNGEKILNTNVQDVVIKGVTLALGTRLKVPDDYFTFFAEASYQHYKMNQWQYFLFQDGISNNAYLKGTISRNSVSDPIYPSSGSTFTLSCQFTPPYSLFNDKFNEENINNLTIQEKFRWVEYHKWKITSSWFTPLAGKKNKLVLNTRVGFGFLGLYNRNLGAAPFERFNLGGSGLSTGGAAGFLLGREIIALRGYDDESVSLSTGGTIISKYTAELRYPFSTNPSATIYGLTFIEAGNTWNNFKDFDPFNVKRSAGVGVRVFLPMFGMLGLDWGYRFDDTPEFRPQSRQHQIHFTIGANIGQL